MAFNKFRYFGRVSRSVSFLLILVLGSFVSANAQEEDCPLPDDKKAVKNWEKGTDKKYKKGERIQFLMEALDVDPDFAQANWSYAEIRVKESRLRGKSYKVAQKHLEKVVDICPRLHSSPYFYLGEIAMEAGDYGKASGYYKQFIDFQSDDDDKFERRYDELLEIAKSNYKISKFFYEEFSNPKPFKPELVTPVSTTSDDEYLPLISPDNEELFFTRRKMKVVQARGVGQTNSVNYTELFSHAALQRGVLKNSGSPMPAPFNTNAETNYGGACVSINNDEIFITICSNQTGYTNCDIYTTKKVYGVNPNSGVKEWYWTDLTSLGPNVNTPTGWESQPTLSRDGKMLLFATLREGETKGIDIYKSMLQPNGTWGKAESLGEPINTDNHEKTPFFHSDSRTLYFSSKGHLNFGGYDVFKSKLNPDGSWTEPMNLGHPINTASDEHGYVVSTDGLKVYYAAKQFNGEETEKVNIYNFDLYKEARPEKVVLLKGKVADLSGAVPKDAQIQVRNNKTDEVESFKVDSVTGSYTAIVTIDDSSEYVVSVKGEDIAFNSVKVTPEDTVETYKTVDVSIQKTEVGKPYPIDNINFMTAAAELTNESKSTLDAFAAYLRDNPEIKISIEGHTDNLGDEQANLALSTERAFSVMAYLQAHGVYKGRMQFKGWGSAKPIASNTTSSGRAKNRRTEFVILSK